MDYKTFIRNVKSLKDYRLTLAKKRRQLKDGYDSLSGLRGVDPGKEPSRSFNESYFMEKKLEHHELLTPIQEEITKLELIIKDTQKNIAEFYLCDQESLYDLMNGYTLSSAADSRGMSYVELSRHLEREYKKRVL